MGVDGGNLVALHHAHSRQADSAMIDADYAADLILKDQSLHRSLAEFGDAFRIHGDDADAVIGAVDLQAAAGVDVCDRLLEAPIHADAAGHRARRRQRHNAADEDGLVGEVRSDYPPADVTVCRQITSSNTRQNLAIAVVTLTRSELTIRY